MALAGLAAAVVTVLTAAIAFETVASALDRRAYPAPGVLVDGGGHQLHLAFWAWSGRTMRPPGCPLVRW